MRIFLQYTKINEKRFKTHSRSNNLADETYLDRACQRTDRDGGWEAGAVARYRHAPAAEAERSQPGQSTAVACYQNPAY